MRVLHILKTSKGAEWARRLIVELRTHGHTLAVMLPDRENGRAEQYEAAGIKVIIQDASLPVKQPWRFFRRRQDFRRVVSEFAPDIIHTHFVTNTLFTRLALGVDATPRLFQIPGPLHLESAFFRRVDIATAGEADFWAGGCRRSCEYLLAAGVSPERVFLNYYGGYGGAECDRYTGPAGVLHRELGLAPDVPLVGMVSYVYPPKRYLGQRRGIKGHEDFADAMARVVASMPEVRGVVIGDVFGPGRGYAERIRRYIRSRCGDRVVWVGFRRDLHRIYRELAVAVHPSHSENLGGAAESLAAGVPTVSTDVGGFPDIVRNGETGLTCPARAPEALADAILKMLRDREFALGSAERGRHLVRELLDIRNTAAETSRIYHRIADRG